jgi:sec-independent protein translocase protein TatA
VQLGPAEILVVLLVALLVFGPSRLPEIGRQVGKGVREFRKFQQTLKGDLDEVFADDASGHAEPAPSLPPREIESGPDPSASSEATEQQPEAHMPSSQAEPAPTDTPPASTEPPA